MTKNMKVLLIVLAVVIVGAVAFFWWKAAQTSFVSGEETAATTSAAAPGASATGATTAGTPAKAPAGTVKTTTTTTTTTSGPVNTAGPAPVVVWRLTGPVADAQYKQHTSISFTADGKEYDVGSVDGTCKILADGSLQDSNEVSAITCTTDAGGSEYGIFRLTSSYVLGKYDLKNATGSVPASRSNFMVIKTLN